MRSTNTSLVRSRCLQALLLLFACIPATITFATGTDSSLPRISSANVLQYDGIQSLADGSYQLAADAAPAVPLLGNYKRSGLIIAEIPVLAQQTNRFKLTYSIDQPLGTDLRVDVRTSPDGTRWEPWQVGLPSGAVLGFARAPERAQYRLTLLGNALSSPLVRNVSFSATSEPATYQAAGSNPFAAAPTFRIRATRQGMVGGRTANGFIIPPRAHFVSLPCWCVLSSNGGNEYQVRISYRGRSSVVPVYDVGPYSGRDDYWDNQRDGFPELDRGWPMDHAAYYEDYNEGWADKGYVRFPTAMDVGDGVWLDDLGIVGDQAEVEVTLLWMGQDPMAGPAPRDPAQPEYLVDELSGDFWHNSYDLTPTPVGCGYGRHAYSTISVTDSDKSTLVARWQPAIPTAGEYDLYVHVPICPHKKSPSTQARYVIQHRDGALEVAIDQSTQTGWVYLGRYPFNADASGFIQLSDIAGDAGKALWYDQAKWVRATP